MDIVGTLLSIADHFLRNHKQDGCRDCEASVELIEKVRAEERTGQTAMDWQAENREGEGVRR